MKCAVSGCGGNPTVAAESPGGAFSIALDAKSFYWIEWLGVLPRKGTAIMKSAK